jgi:hypothetical protein
MSSARKRREHETDDSEDSLQEKTNETVPKKKPKVYLQKYRPEYHKLFPCIVASNKGESYAFCTHCGADFKVCHGGKNYVQRHVDRQKKK